MNSPSSPRTGAFTDWNRRLHYYLGLYFLFFIWFCKHIDQTFRKSGINLFFRPVDANDNRLVNRNEHLCSFPDHHGQGLVWQIHDLPDFSKFTLIFVHHHTANKLMEIVLIVFQFRKSLFWKKKFELMRDHKLEAQVRQAAL
jgi:hypothetical protein